MCGTSRADMLNNERQSFSSNIRSKTGRELTFTPSMKCTTEIHTSAIRQEEKKKASKFERKIISVLR
jgi:hypothetical protein